MGEKGRNGRGGGAYHERVAFPETDVVDTPELVERRPEVSAVHFRLEMSYVELHRWL